MISRNYFLVGLVFLMVGAGLGCEGIVQKREKPKGFEIPQIEADWIRKGEPLVFEGASWYPQDTVENLLDKEMYYMGDYKGVQFFIERIDVRPYNRLYTKFGKNKFRVFKKKLSDD